MGKSNKISLELEERLKKVIKQLSGNIKADDGDLIPEVAIKGIGDIFCYYPLKRSFIKINRGIKAYLIEEGKSEFEPVLIYTIGGHLIEIDKEELIYTGFD